MRVFEHVSDLRDNLFDDHILQISRSEAESYGRLDLCRNHVWRKRFVVVCHQLSTVDICCHHIEEYKHYVSVLDKGITDYQGMLLNGKCEQITLTEEVN